MFSRKRNRRITNRKAISLMDLSIISFLFLILAYAGTYMFAAVMQETVVMQLNMIANSIVDVVSENRELNEATQNKFKEDIDRYGWYIGSYTIEYSTVEIHDDSINTNVIGTSTNGNSIGEVALNKNDLFRVEIVSSQNTMLTRVTQVLGGSAITEAIGFAEGCVD